MQTCIYKPECKCEHMQNKKTQIRNANECEHMHKCEYEHQRWHNNPEDETCTCANQAQK